MIYFVGFGMSIGEKPEQPILDQVPLVNLVFGLSTPEAQPPLIGGGGFESIVWLVCCLVLCVFSMFVFGLLFVLFCLGFVCILFFACLCMC